MRHFSEKATGRRTEDNSNPNSYQAQKENPMFFKKAQRGVLLPECQHKIYGNWLSS